MESLAYLLRYGAFLSGVVGIILLIVGIVGLRWSQSQVENPSAGCISDSFAGLMISLGVVLIAAFICGLVII